MDAIAFLINEHNKVRRKLKSISKASQRYSAKKIKFVSLCKDLVKHESLEQKVWYPHFKNNKKIKKEVRHLLSEEKHAAQALKKFKGIKTEAEWNKSFSKLKKAVEQHAHEESKLFPNVKKILDKAELNQIAKKMRSFMSKRRKKAH